MPAILPCSGWWPGRALPAQLDRRRVVAREHRPRRRAPPEHRVLAPPRPPRPGLVVGEPGDERALLGVRPVLGTGDRPPVPEAPRVEVGLQTGLTRVVLRRPGS